MKKIILTAMLLAGLSVKARASTDVNVITSTITYGGVICTTGTTSRIDNFADGLSSWSVVAVGTSSVIPETRIGLATLLSGDWAARTGNSAGAAP